MSASMFVWGDGSVSNWAMFNLIRGRLAILGGSSSSNMLPCGYFSFNARIFFVGFSRFYEAHVIQVHGFAVHLTFSPSLTVGTLNPKPKPPYCNQFPGSRI